MVKEAKEVRKTRKDVAEKAFHGKIDNRLTLDRA